MNKKLIFCTISLADKAGGLERNIINISNMFDINKYHVEIISFDMFNARSFYKINQNIKWHKVGTHKPHTKINIIERIKQTNRIRSILQSENSIIICFHHGISFRFILANLFLNNKLVISERNSLSLYNHINKSKFNINYLSLFFVSKIFVQFNRYIKQYPKKLHKIISVIPNFVEQHPDFINESKIINREKIIISIGRLESQKNFNILIRVFYNLSKKHKGWKLFIIGNGSKKNELINLIELYKLSEIVIIKDSTSDIDSYYKKASIFCLLSQWEGFCNSVSEALSFGVPCIGLETSDGISDLIIHKFNGLLANNYNNNDNDIIKCFDTLINNENLRLEYSINAINSVRKYEKNKVFKIWEHNISNV